MVWWFLVVDSTIAAFDSKVQPLVLLSGLPSLGLIMKLLTFYGGVCDSWWY